MDLRRRLQAITGIPPHHQKLLVSNRMLADTGELESIVSGSNIWLHVSGKGGTDKCELCFGDAKFCCSECTSNQVTCTPCCERIHMHPERKSHKPQNIAGPSTLLPTMLQDDSKLNEYDFPSSPETD